MIRLYNKYLAIRPGVHKFTSKFDMLVEKLFAEAEEKNYDLRDLANILIQTIQNISAEKVLRRAMKMRNEERKNKRTSIIIKETPKEDDDDKPDGHELDEWELFGGGTPGDPQ